MRDPKADKKRFVPTVRQYKEDLTVLHTAGPNALLGSVFSGRGHDPTRRPPRTAKKLAS